MEKNMQFLDFERAIQDVVERREEVKTLAEEGRTDLPEKNLAEELERLEIKEKRVTRMIYRDLNPFKKVQIARHPNRPHPKAYIDTIITDFIPLAGDRRFADDKTILAGIGKFNGQGVAVIGTRKGNNTSSRMKYNFGMPKPEGYRKALRIMDMAEKFKLPLITFVDTPGAFPGIDAEARGQAEAIASCIEKLLSLNVPVITFVTGEGGSGGALAIAVANHVYMLEHSIYSVISPEGCASILWKEATKETIPLAAGALKLTAQDLSKLGIIDGIVKEPVGAAHRDVSLTIGRVKRQIKLSLTELAKEKNIKEHRYQKFIAMTRG
jgi:acetyl-CoA carboxylase carboxyl transferase subunit alpha